MKKRVVVIGGGFAGLSALRIFSRFRKEVECFLVDRKDCSEFLPLLPDVVGGRIRPEFLKTDLSMMAGRLGFQFRHAEVEGLSPARREVRLAAGSLGYDYLLVCCGSETNFHGNRSFREAAGKLDGVEDALKLRALVESDAYPTYVISGGGYTGVEVAANLKLRLDRLGRKRRIVIVEGSPRLMGMLPDRIRGCVTAGLGRLGIECLVNTMVRSVQGDRITLTSGLEIPGSCLIWTAGVKIPDLVRDLGEPGNGQGRLPVDRHLRLDRSSFAAGDAAGFASGAGFLRMSVQAALSQGRCAAFNIIRDIRGRPLRRYRPFDPGLVVPLVSGGCGRALGFNFSGRSPLLLHYLMSVWRSYGLRNRLGILRDLWKGGPG